MSTPIKLVAVGAALLIVILGGAVFIGGGGEPALPAPTITPSPSPVASASPSAPPSAGAVFPDWWSSDAGQATDDNEGAGILASGSHTTESFSPGLTYSVPEGWVNDGDSSGYFSLFQDTPANAAEFARSGGLAHGIIMGPHDSPWFVCDAWENHQGTSAEMVASMLATEALAMSEPIDVTIGGLTGKQVDVRLDPAWTESCPGDPPTLDLAEQRTRGFLLDNPDRGVIVIFVGGQSAGHEAFLAEAMPIVESFEFDLPN